MRLPGLFLFQMTALSPVNLLMKRWYLLLKTHAMHKQRAPG